MIEEIAERTIGELNRLRVDEMDRPKLAAVKRGVEEIREIARRFSEHDKAAERWAADQIQEQRAAKKSKGKR